MLHNDGTVLDMSIYTETGIFKYFYQDILRAEKEILTERLGEWNSDREIFPA